MSIVTILAWAVPLLSGTGLAIFIGLLFLAPEAALVVEKVALRIFNAIISTRIGCVAIALTIAGPPIYFYGGHVEGARVQAEWDGAEHAGIEESNEARDDAEKAIAPAAVDPDALAPAPVKTETFHFPHIFNLSKATDACPPVQKCAAARRPRAVDPRVRNDPNNRDNH